MVLIRDRTFDLEILEMSTLSMKREPQFGSRIRSSVETKDDLPLFHESIKVDGVIRGGIHTCQSYRIEQSSHCN